MHKDIGARDERLPDMGILKKNIILKSLLTKLLKYLVIMSLPPALVFIVKLLASPIEMSIEKKVDGYGFKIHMIRKLRK